MRLVRTIFLAAALVPASSCLPWPHLEVMVPALAGCVQGRDGERREGMKVEIAVKGEGILWRGSTDARGRFWFPGKRRFKLFRPIVPGDRIVPVSIRIFDKDRLLLTHETGIGPGNEDSVRDCLVLPS